MITDADETPTESTAIDAPIRPLVWECIATIADHRAEADGTWAHAALRHGTGGVTMLVDSTASETAWRQVRFKADRKCMIHAAEVPVMADTVTAGVVTLIRHHGREMDLDLPEDLSDQVRAVVIAVLRQAVAMPQRLQDQLSLVATDCCAACALGQLIDAEASDQDTLMGLQHQLWEADQQAIEDADRIRDLEQQLLAIDTTEVRIRIAELRGEIARTDGKAGIAVPALSAAIAAVIAGGGLTGLSATGEVLATGALTAAFAAVIEFASVVMPRLRRGGHIGVMAQPPAASPVALLEELAEEQSVLADIVRRKFRRIRDGMVAVSAAGLLAAATVITHLVT